MSTVRTLILGCASALWAAGCGLPASTAGLHQSCSASGCASGQTCLSYCGLACAPDGGPTFQTCEIPCAGDSACPLGTTCVTVNDGPGTTCQ